MSTNRRRGEMVKRECGSIALALPPDVWWRLCPTESRLSLLIGAAPQERDIAPSDLCCISEGQSPSAHQTAKPGYLISLATRFLTEDIHSLNSETRSGGKTT